MEQPKKFDESVVNLSNKMAEDKEFQDELNKVESIKQMYDVYTKYGYTDQPYETFEQFFNILLTNQMQTNQVQTNNPQELSDEELETVAAAGLFSKLFKYVKKAISYVPVVGPCVNTVIDAAESVAKVVKDPKNALNTLKDFGKNLCETGISVLPGVGTGYSILQDCLDGLRDCGANIPGTKISDSFKI